MQMQDFVTEEEAEKLDGCTVCEVHERAYKIMGEESALACPTCKTPISDSVFNHTDIHVVGIDNGYAPENPIAKRHVFKCECGQTSTISLRPILYNANHDIYYTGHERFEPRGFLWDYEANKQYDWTEMAKQRIQPSIANWTERVKAGGKLDEWYLTLWISREFEKLAAEQYSKFWKDQPL